jgi:hypothetical protein
MSRLVLEELYLLNLKGEIQEGRREYTTKDRAYQKLKELTGQDFGMDPVRWEAYLKEHDLLTPQFD